MALEWSPLLPLPLIALIGVIVVIAAGVRFVGSRTGAALRLLSAAAICLFLLGPTTTEQIFEPLPDQALILIDQSSSTQLGERPAITDAARSTLRTKLEAEGVDVIEASFGDGETSDLAEGLTSGLGAADRDQLAAIFVLSDGQVSGGDNAIARELPVPLHSVLVGDPARERDRSVRFLSAPRFGIVGDQLTFEFIVEDHQSTDAIPAFLSVDGERIANRMVRPGEASQFSLPMERPGARVVEIEVPRTQGELTLRNNSVSAGVNVIRDRLRVLLISGEPHAGERVWRNVLKSDPAVDLVHFTILKPGNKEVTASRAELNLIEFPSRELFRDKLEHFNVVVFDRYTYRNVISASELASVTRYVERGGALLIAAGPELSGDGSLVAQATLSRVLPIGEMGRAAERAFVPQVSALGERHPITGTLEGRGDWGRWLRHIPADVRSGDVLMTAGDVAPLLITDRVGDGRIAMLLSDHLWLWSRGFDGGGPHREFLRRLVHWLMAEPELEEEALAATLSESGRLEIRRRTLAEEVGTVRITLDDETPETVGLEQQAEGVFSLSIEGVEANRVTLETTTEDGEIFRAAALRSQNPSQELAQVSLTGDYLGPASAATAGGTIAWTSADFGGPALRRVRAGRETKHGRDWLGFVPRQARTILSESASALAPRWLYALLAGGLLMLAWLVESGRLPTPTWLKRVVRSRRDVHFGLGKAMTGT
ncbi:MAG: hypothetical protein AAGI89_04270 [Pseudomonadota bacterium]